MKTNRYEITIFDSSNNSRFIVSMFATCMTQAVINAKDELVRKGITKRNNIFIRNITKGGSPFLLTLFVCY